MGNIPTSLQRLLLTSFDISGNPTDPNLKGLTLRCEHGEARFVVSRQQLLDLAEEFRKCAEGMPKPS